MRECGRGIIAVVIVVRSRNETARFDATYETTSETSACRRGGGGLISLLIFRTRPSARDYVKLIARKSDAGRAISGGIESTIAQTMIAVDHVRRGGDESSSRVIDTAGSYQTRETRLQYGTTIVCEGKRPPDTSLSLSRVSVIGLWESNCERDRRSANAFPYAFLTFSAPVTQV